MKAVDVMGFGGGFAAGVDQAGFEVIAKREPSKFKGFGVQSHVYNMPWMEAQVSDPEDWALPAEPVELVFGNPPCSGFSQLSHANTIIHGNVVGPDAEINECMFWFNDYVARVKPRVAIMESVGVAFKSGREFMEDLWRKLRDDSGLPYHLTHVNMNAAYVGGDVIRPRYFYVVHLDDFGVGIDFVMPRSMGETIGDLPEDEDDDTDWGHQTHRSTGTIRWNQTLKWLREQGREWQQGTRLPQNVEGLEPPEFWIRRDGKTTERSLKHTPLPVYSHWYSTDPFSTVRWRWDRPYGVVVAAVLDRSVHPIYDRCLTYREAARFMSLPDTWSLRALVENREAAALGKGIPAASGKWIAHWAKMSIEGTPGEFAGIPTSDPDVRIISVQNERQIQELYQRPPKGAFYTEGFSDGNPDLWMIDLGQRPGRWPQRDANPTLPKVAIQTKSAAVRAQVEHVESRSVARRTNLQQGREMNAGIAPRPTETPASPAKGEITRIQPEVVSQFLSDHRISVEEAAKRYGVSTSRIRELVTHTRPKSWLNADRWEEFQLKMQGLA